MIDSARRLDHLLSAKGGTLVKKLGKDYSLWRERERKSREELQKIQAESIERSMALMERDIEETHKTIKALREIFRKHSRKIKA